MVSFRWRARQGWRQYRRGGAGGSAHGKFHVPQLLHGRLAGVADQVDQDLGATRTGGTDGRARGGEGGPVAVVAEIAQHVIMADEREVPAEAQAPLTGRAAHADGGNDRRDHEGGRRIVPVQHVAGGGIAIGLGHHVGGHDRGIARDTTGLQRLLVARAAAGGEIEAFLAVYERHAAMPEIEQEVGGATKGGGVGDIEPAVVLGRGSTSMDEERNAELLQKRHAGVVDLGALEHHAIDRAVGHHLAIRILRAAGADHRQQHVVAFAHIDLARTGEEIGEDRVHHLGPACKRDDVADRHGAPRGQAARTRIGRVIGGIGGGQHARTGLFAHLRIAVQGAADSCLRKTERLGQFPEIHGFIGLKALSSSAEAMPASRDLSKIQNRPFFLHLRD
jgi:hypothetical protein